VAGNDQQQQVPLHKLAVGAGASGDPCSQAGHHCVPTSASSQLAGASWPKGANITPSF